MDDVAGAQASVTGERRRLLDIAYRLLGSLAEAEDAVQEAFVRWLALSPEQRAAIETPAAWLTTVTTRVCLDVLGSARSRRERYVGEWVPEPLPEPGEWARPADLGGDPADRITLDESVSMAFLVVLEAMTPAERVAFVLHDVFRYDFASVAEITGRSVDACRQLASSARRRVNEARVPATPTSDRAEVVRDFGRAWSAKDVGALLRLLDPSATFVADGGGLVSAVIEPIEGAEAVARFCMAIAANATDDVALLARSVNGEPGLVIRQGDAIGTVLSFELDGGRITRIWAMRNPDKLTAWAGLAERGLA